MLQAAVSRFCHNHARQKHSQRWSSGFSSTWQKMGKRSEGDGDSAVIPPDPIRYLEGFDLVAKDYKNALTRACDLTEGHHVLDLGCGTATEAAEFSKIVGSSGRVELLDRSEELIQRAKLKYRDSLRNVNFSVGDIYQLDFPTNSFDVVREDRVLQHLQRPYEAVQEMVRVTRPGGTIVVSNPDFHSFSMDLASQWWGEARRAPIGSQSVGTLTAKVLGGVIPTLCVHPSLGIQTPRLLRAAGCSSIQLQVYPLLLHGLRDLERVVPVSYMAELSQANGAITDQERVEWLDRLLWEGESLFGVLQMYICRGVKPGKNDEVGDNPWGGSSIGKRFFSDLPEPTIRTTVKTRLASTFDTQDLIEEARQLINNEYSRSDTGSTLSSMRLRPQDVQSMVAKNELIVSFDEESGDLIGCIQVKIKQNDESSGLPAFGANESTEVVAEFTCLAVSSDTKATVSNADTQQVRVQLSNGDKSRRNSGVGATLVRAAEAYARSKGASRMTLGIMCPAHGPEPAYKVWLQDYYRKLGYDWKETVTLDFETDAGGKVVVDQLHDMYEPLHQLVQCKAILFDKKI